MFEQQGKLRHGKLFLPDLPHYPQPPVTHPNHRGPEKMILKKQETTINTLLTFVCAKIQYLVYVIM